MGIAVGFDEYFNTNSFAARGDVGVMVKRVQTVFWSSEQLCTNLRTTSISGYLGRLILMCDGKSADEYPHPKFSKVANILVNHAGAERRASFPSMTWYSGGMTLWLGTLKKSI